MRNPSMVGQVGAVSQVHRREVFPPQRPEQLPQRSGIHGGILLKKRATGGSCIVTEKQPNVTDHRDTSAKQAVTPRVRAESFGLMSRLSRVTVTDRGVTVQGDTVTRDSDTATLRSDGVTITQPTSSDGVTVGTKHPRLMCTVPGCGSRWSINMGYGNLCSRHNGERLAQGYARARVFAEAA